MFSNTCQANETAPHDHFLQPNYHLSLKLGSRRLLHANSLNHVPACSKHSKIICKLHGLAFLKPCRIKSPLPPLTVWKCLPFSEEPPPQQNVPPGRVLLNPSHNNHFRNLASLPMPMPNSRPELLTRNWGRRVWRGERKEEVQQRQDKALPKLRTPGMAPTLHTANLH